METPIATTTSTRRGALIRNGTVYRAEPTSADVCVLFQNGEMKTYSPDQFDLQQVMQEGAYQSWTFGPSLLDAQGKALSTFNTWDYIRKVHPPQRHWLL